MTRLLLRAAPGLFAFALLGASPVMALAQKIEKPVVYAGFGSGIVGGSDMASLSGVLRGSSDVDKDGPGTAWTAFGGAKIKGYAVETGYLGRTHEEFSLRSDESATEGVVIKRRAFYVAGAADIKLDLKKPAFLKKLVPYAKAGIAWWRVDISGDDVDVTEGWDPLVGLGASFRLSKKIDVRVEALIVLADDDRISDDQHYFLLSGCWKF